MGRLVLAIILIATIDRSPRASALTDTLPRRSELVGTTPNPVPRRSRGAIAGPREPRNGAPAARRVTASATFALTSLDQQIGARGEMVTPPDAFIAAGPSHLVEVVNTTVSVWNKASGARLGGPTSLKTLVGAPASHRVSDPRVAYDAASDRWFLTLMSFDSITQSAGRVYRSVAGEPTMRHRLPRRSTTSRALA